MSSLLALLAAGGGTAFVTPGGEPPPPPGSSATPKPPVINDPVLMQMRPTEHMATLVVAQDGSGDFATIGEAMTRASALRAAGLAASGRTLPRPQDRILILVKPGHYVEPPNLGNPLLVSVIATDPTRGATTMEPGTAPAPGLYWEGIDIVNVTAEREPKYGAHVRFVGAGPWPTIVMARCTLKNPSTSSGGGGTAIGMDGNNGITMVLHDVTLDTGGTPANSTNMHGWSTLTQGCDMIYSNVRSASVNYTALGAVLADHMWVIGGDIDSVGLDSAGGTLHLDPATGAASVSSTGARDERTDWPIPIGALSERDRAIFTP